MDEVEQAERGDGADLEGPEPGPVSVNAEPESLDEWIERGIGHPDVRMDLEVATEWEAEGGDGAVDGCALDLSEPFVDALGEGAHGVADGRAEPLSLRLREDAVAAGTTAAVPIAP